MGESEVALLDVREEHDSAQGHIVLATLAPMSRLEVVIAGLVPRRSVPIVLCDGGDGALAEQAADALHRLDYQDLSILDGGVDAWRRDGGSLYPTTYVLAKLFGGVAARRYGVPSIDARELRASIAAGKRVTVLDARPLIEFRAGSVEGAINCPLAELPYRVPALVPDPDTLVVVTCASRTRGILGAQSLRQHGLPNPVAVLENGLMAWTLAGGAVMRLSDRVAPEPSRDTGQRRRAAASPLAGRVKRIGLDDLGRFEAELDRSLYLFDVRTPEAYAAGHLRQARSAPGGQLIMTLLQLAATHRARVVLVDDGDGLRAGITAFWMAQIGRHDVYVLTETPEPSALVAGPERAATEDGALQRALADVPWIGPADAAGAARAGEAAVLDVETSLTFKEGHLPRAWFAMRRRLPEGLHVIPEEQALIITSTDGTLAGLVAQELSGRTRHAVHALEGGTAAWAALGLPIESGEGRALHAMNDLWPSPMRAEAGRLEAYAEYLGWETTLADCYEREPIVEFIL